MSDEHTNPHEIRLYAALEDASEAVEAERRRLAQLLETGIIGPLNTLLAQATTYEQTLAANPQARMAASVLASLARQVLQQTIDLKDNLHPDVLEVLGLEPALEALASQYTRAYATRIHLNLTRIYERMPALVELALFRAAHDALRRAVESAHATDVLLRLTYYDERLTLQISDNGTDTDDTSLYPALQRIQALGGQADLETGDRGCALTLSFRIEHPVELTEREMEVIQPLAEGLSNKEIAGRLNISTRTVKFHLDNIYSKLGVSTRTEAAVYALRQGWVRRDDPVQPDRR